MRHLDAHVLRPQPHALEERDHGGQQLGLRLHPRHSNDVQVPLPGTRRARTPRSAPDFSFASRPGRHCYDLPFMQLSMLNGEEAHQ